MLTVIIDFEYSIFINANHFRKRKMYMKKIVYPIFLECCQYTNDIFWENIFENLAYGKAPYGSYISKNFLCCGYKQKEFNYKIEKKDSETVYKEVFSLLTNRLGIFSQQEKDFTNLENDIKNSRKNWNDIKKNVKELLIELYVSRMRNKYSLSIKQARHLLSTILIAIVFKAITVNDIDYSNGRINKIDGINFTKKQVIITRNLWDINPSFTSCIFVDKKFMANNWEKYLEGLRKISAKNLVKIE